MNFSEALELLKKGKRLRRAAWKNVSYVVACSGGGVTRPYLIAVDPTGMRQPGWLAAQTDLFAEDWEVDG